MKMMRTELWGLRDKKTHEPIYMYFASRNSHRAIFSKKESAQKACLYPDNIHYEPFKITGHDSADQWISVKDGMPKIPEDKAAKGYDQIQVVVWCDDGMQFAWYEPFTGKFLDIPGWDGREINHVTHWMPRLKPPEWKDSYER